MENKRGQLTMMIIIAIIVVGTIAVWFLLRDRGTISPDIGATKLDSQEFIENCIEESLQPALETMMPQGGYLEPTNYTLYRDTKIQFLCYDGGYYNSCVNTEPMYIEYLESELREFLAPKIEICFDQIKKEYEKASYTVSMEATDFDVQLRPKQIFIPISKKINLQKGDTSESIESFDATVLHPIYDLAILAMGITNGEAKNCDFDYFKYRNDHTEYDMQRILTGNNVRIYTIGNEIRLQFATRSCALPGAY